MAMDGNPPSERRAIHVDGSGPLVSLPDTPLARYPTARRWRPAPPEAKKDMEGPHEQSSVLAVLSGPQQGQHANAQLA